MNYAEFRAESRRLALLRVLAESPGYSANESVLQTALDGLGFRESRDTVRADMNWLAEQGLARVEDVGVMVSTLTARGEDVASGRGTHPGVQRPKAGG